MNTKKIFGVSSQSNRNFLPIIVLVVAAVAVRAQSAPPEFQPTPNVTQTPANAQPTPGSVQPAATPSPIGVASAEDQQNRVGRARALAAAHQLGAAARELESVRATTTDGVLRNGTSVMLLGIYLEEGNYSRAQSLLEETFQARADAGENSLRSYFALADQAVNGVRQHLARYRSFGVSTSGTTLPPEAVNDIERLRVLLERMIAQAKDLTRDFPKGNDALALLEDVLGVRASLGRDTADRERWQTEYAQARAQLGFARMELNANGDGVSFAAPAPNPGPAQGNVDSPQQDSASRNPDPSPSQIIYAGMLNERASNRVVPTYPQLAKTARAQGVVKVHVIVSEGGEVRVTMSEGPTLLRQAAEDAARAWRFTPAVVDGRAVKLTGYIEFNFTN